MRLSFREVQGQLLVIHEYGSYERMQFRNSLDFFFFLYQVVTVISIPGRRGIPAVRLSYTHTRTNIYNNIPTKPTVQSHTHKNHYSHVISTVPENIYSEFSHR